MLLHTKLQYYGVQGLPIKARKRMRSPKILVIEADDFNAKSKVCYNPTEDAIGSLLAELMPHSTWLLATMGAH